MNKFIKKFTCAYKLQLFFKRHVKIVFEIALTYGWNASQEFMILYAIYKINLLHVCNTQQTVLQSSEKLNQINQLRRFRICQTANKDYWENWNRATYCALPI